MGPVSAAIYDTVFHTGGFCFDIITGFTSLPLSFNFGILGDLGMTSPPEKGDQVSTGIPAGSETPASLPPPSEVKEATPGLRSLIRAQRIQSLSACWRKGEGWEVIHRKVETQA